MTQIQMENVIKKAGHSTRVAEATGTVEKIEKALRTLTKRSESTFSVLSKQHNSMLKNEKASLVGEKSSLEREARQLQQQMEQLQITNSSLASEVGELKKELETQQVEHEKAFQQDREQAKKQCPAKTGSSVSRARMDK